MSAREWAPGDVALVRPMYCDHPDVVAVRTGVPGNEGWAYSMVADNGKTTQSWSSDPDGLSVVRPLVVIDPEDREQVERLVRIYYHDGGGPLDELASRMQAALRGFVNPKPQKPEEPQGLGAVVEDGAGSRFVRSDVETCNPWRGPNGLPWEWSDIDAVRVLSEGVTP